MPPEEIERLAAQSGFTVSHFPHLGYSTVHTPAGDEQVGHATPPRARVAPPPPPPPAPARVRERPTVDMGSPMALDMATSAPTPAPAPRVGVPPMLARPPEAPASIATTPQQQRADALRREAAAQRTAYDEQQRQERLRADEEQLSADFAREEQQYGHYSDPDQYGIVTHTRPDGTTERIGDRSAFERERFDRESAAARATPTHAGTRTFADGQRVTTDDAGHIVRPGLDLDRLRAEMAGGGRTAMSTEEVPTLTERLSDAGRAITGAVEELPAVQYLSGEDPQTFAETNGVAPRRVELPADPTLDRVVVPGPTAPGAAPTAPRPARRGGGGAGGRPVQTGPTLPQMVEGIAGMPEARAAFDQTIGGLARDPRYGGQFDTIGRQMLLEQQRAGLATKAAQTQARIEQDAEQQRQQLEAERQQALQGARQRYQNAIDRVSSMHLDPGRWFRDQGAGGVVASTIAVALGALGQALTGSSTNSALDQINQAVDRDLEAQRSEIDAARAGADLTGNMLDVMRGEFSDRQAAQDAARAAMLQQAALHIQEQEGELAGQEAQTNADALREQLAAQAAEAQAAAEERQSQIDLRHAQTLRELARAQQEGIRANRMMSGGGGAQPHVSSADLATFDAIRRANPEITPEQAAALAGLPEGFVPTQSSAADTQHQRGPLNAALSELERAIPAEGDIPGVGTADSHVPTWLLGEEGRRMRSLVQRTLIRLLRVDSGGVIGADEVQQYADMYGLNEGATEQQFRDGVRAMRADFDAGVFDALAAGDSTSHEHSAVGFTPD